MINLLTLAFSIHAALTPVKVHVDGAGYIRFVRDGRAVYAKAATFVNIDGDVGFEGAKVLPEIPIPTGTQTIKVDLQGNIDAGAQHLGRLVLAIFPAGATSSSTDDFFTFSERPTLTNPGEDTAGVIRVDGDPVTPHDGAGSKPNTPPAKTTSGSAPQILGAHSDPQVKPSKTQAHTQAASQPTGAQIEILVRQHSEIVGDSFSLGDIATISGPDEIAEAYREVKIGAPAAAGFNRIIDPRFLVLKLRGAGHTEGSYVLVVPEGADVARKVKSIPAQDIIDSAIKAAQDKVGSPIEFRITSSVIPIVAQDGDIVLEASDPERTTKGYLVVITAREGSVIVGTEQVTLVPPAQIGEIKLGDSVHVLLKSGTAVIDVEGRALSAGFVGQKVKVSVTVTADGGNSKTTTHTGTVIESGKVEVDL